MADYRYIGKSIRRDDALPKVTGEAAYTGDILVPGMLFGKIKTSPCAFGRILSINTAKARRLPGVRAVITAADVTQRPFGVRIPDELPLADKYVRYIGDAVAAVAAIDGDIAEEALDLIEIAYEELPPLLSAEKAREAAAAAIHAERAEVRQNVAYRIDFTRGSGEAAFKEADLVLEDRFTTQAVHPAPIEPQTTIARWDSGKLTLWASTQSVFNTRRMVAMGLGIPEDSIKVFQPYLGGAFGAKIWLLTHHLAAAFLARAAGRPVKIVYTREEDFAFGRPRIAEAIDLKMGFKKDGTMVAKSSAITADVGAYTGLSPSIVLMSATRPDCLYRLPNIKLTADLVYTNTVPRGSFRGFGNPQMQFAMESLIDMAAEKLGIDPMGMRLKNRSQQGDTTAHGWLLKSCEFGETLRVAREQAGWPDKRLKRKAGRGVGVACQVHVAGNRVMHPLYDGSAAFVHVNHNGKVKVISGESDLGQGMTTVFAQIAAEELDVPVEDVEVLHTPDTETVSYCGGTFGDRVTVLGGGAVRMAATDARRQLTAHAAAKLACDVADIVYENGKLYVKGSPEKTATLKEIAYYTVFKKLSGLPVTGRGEFSVPDYVAVPDITGYGNLSVAYTFGTAVAEVAVDTETGKVDVLNFWFPMDVGKALNPKLCEVQVEGGVVQGMGYALTEDCLMDKEGRVLNPSFTDYKIPQARGTPRIHCAWIEEPNPGSPYGIKGIGESVINPIAPAIANAIYNAVGVRIKDLPITPEKILKALKEKKR